MASLMNSNVDPHQEYDGCKFLFAYNCPKDKVWYVQPRRFMLLKDSNKNILQGQFIQSSWFQVSYKQHMTGVFVVLKVDKNLSGQTIEKDMNSLKNPFPSLFDIPPYVKKASYFHFPWPIMDRCIKESKEKQDDFKFTVRADNNPWDKLELSIYYDRSAGYLSGMGVLITHPCFTIQLH